MVQEKSKITSNEKSRAINQISYGTGKLRVLETIWKQEKMTTFRNFLHLYDNKDVIATIETMQKMIKFCHDNGIDMLKIG